MYEIIALNAKFSQIIIGRLNTRLGCLSNFMFYNKSRICTILQITLKEPGARMLTKKTEYRIYQQGEFKFQAQLKQTKKFFIDCEARKAPPKKSVEFELVNLFY